MKFLKSRATSGPSITCFSFLCIFSPSFSLPCWERRREGYLTHVRPPPQREKGITVGGSRKCLNSLKLFVSSQWEILRGRRKKSPGEEKQKHIFFRKTFTSFPANFRFSLQKCIGRTAVIHPYTTHLSSSSSYIPLGLMEKIPSPPSSSSNRLAVTAEWKPHLSFFSPWGRRWEICIPQRWRERKMLDLTLSKKYFWLK